MTMAAGSVDTTGLSRIRHRELSRGTNPTAPPFRAGKRLAAQPEDCDGKVCYARVMYRMKRAIRVAPLLAQLLFSQAPSDPKPRKDSITVSAGIPSERAKLEEDCDRKIKDAEALAARNEPTKALALLDEAWRMTEASKFLDSRRWHVLRTQGRALLRAQQPDKAIVAFQKRLDLESDDCMNAADGVPAANTCAEALMELGTAQMMAGKSTEAVKNLLQAAEYFRICTKESPATSELARVSYQKFAAESTVMAAVGQIRLGKQPEARKLLGSGIMTLEGVISHPKSSDALKANASQILQFARQQAEALK